MKVLEVSRLDKRYGAIHALRNASFSVARGEIFGYLGPNGSGKTTTLRIAAGLVRADRGKVHLLGEPSTRARSRERVGYVPGELRLYGDLTGQALLDHFAGFRPRRPPALRERLLEVLDLRHADIERRVKHLSQGTRQKLGLIIAMQHDPELLLLDEPSTGLDPLVQAAFRTFLLERAACGRAVLLSSHVLSEVEAVCARVAILKAGEVVALESIADLRRRVVRRLQARFRHAPPDLSLVAGVLRAVGSGREVTLWVEGDVQPLLRRLASTELEHFVFPEPELEDIFLGFYRTGIRGSDTLAESGG